MTNERLEALVEQCRGIKMTLAQEREQEISFAYGNLKLHDPTVTREIVERAWVRLYEKRVSAPAKAELVAMAQEDGDYD